MTDIAVKLKLKDIEESVDKADIAIVDDDPSFSFMLKDYLFSSSGLLSDLFSSSEEFFRDYHTKDNRKIILDFDFGKGVDGLAILQKIRSINPRANVIMVSSKDDLETAVEIIKNGALDYFLKTNKTVFANIVCSLRKIEQLERNQLN